MTDLVLTVACPSRRGIVAAVAGFLADHGCNITDSAQFDDLANGRFFMRVQVQSGFEQSSFEQAVGPLAVQLNATWHLDYVGRRRRTLVRLHHVLDQPQRPARGAA